MVLPRMPDFGAVTFVIVRSGAWTVTATAVTFLLASLWPCALPSSATNSRKRLPVPVCGSDSVPLCV